MSETLRDLVVSLSLNSDNFTRNIKSIQRQIQEAESAFKLASAGVDKFEQTTAGLSSHLTTLERKLSLQKDAVGQYEKALQSASAKLQECYDRQNDYAQRLEEAKQKQAQLKQEVASAAAAYKTYKASLGETDSATIAAKANLDAVKVEYRESVAEIRKLEGQNVALKKSTQNAADAFSAAQTKLNGAKAAVKETGSEIKKTTSALELSRTQWDAAGDTIVRSGKAVASIGKQMQNAESRFRLAAAGVKDFDKSAEGLSAKLTLLREKLVLQQQAVQEYERALAAAKEQLQAAQSVNDPERIRQATDAVQDAEIKLNNARAAVKQTQADIASCSKELKTASSAWTAAGKSMEEFGKRCEKAGRTMTTIGRTLTRTITTPILALGTAAIKASVDYESAFTSVRKTVDATEAEFNQLSDSIKEMSTQVAASATDIAEVTAVAGQLGIQNDHLMEFTRTMIDLGNSTDIVADEAASTLAKFANIMNMDQSLFENLGSTLVDLGNNYATTESAIMEMSMRLAGAGHQVGLSEAQILGFATALSSVGIEAQMGGSAFSKALVKMEVASATGGQALEDFGKVAGMAGAQFKVLWDADPAAAFQAFIVGLSQLDDEGESAIAVLDEIGIKEVRLRDTLLRATNATELFSATQVTANNAWKQNTALATEAGKRYGTMESRMTNLKNTAVLFAQTIGNDLTPTINNLMSGASDLLESFTGMDEAQRMQIIRFAAVAAAIGPVLLMTGRLTTGIGKVSTGIGRFATAVGKAGGGFKGFMSVLGKSPSVWMAVAAAVVVGTVALADYVTGAKQAREALEGMKKTAEDWKNTAADTFYGSSQGLSFFGMTENDFKRDTINAKSWLDGVIALWSDGQKETDEIITAWTDSWKNITASTRAELQEMKDTADQGGYTTVSDQLAAGIAALDAMDSEIERLLKKKKNKTLTEKDKIRLGELIDAREAIEVKYHLSAADLDSFETIGQKVAAEVARAQARGQTDASVTVYENAMTAAAEGMAAINSQLDAQYDKEYAVIQLIENSAERQEALEELNKRYNENRLSAAREYAAAMAGVIMPVWNETDIQKAGADIDTLTQKLAQYSAASEGEKPALLQELNELTAGMDEGSVTEYIALLTQVQSLLDSGMSEAEVQAMFPEIDFSTQLEQIAAIQAFLNGRETLLPGLSSMFSEAIPDEILKITTDLDMTGAQARWDEFAANPGAITTAAVISGFTDAEGVTKPEIAVSAFVSSYTEIAEGASTASLTPTGILAYVTRYAEATTGTDVSSLTPDQITAIVSGYKELATGTDVSLLTPDDITAYVSKYLNGTEVDQTGLTPAAITATVMAYQEVTGGALTTALTPTDIAAIVTEYLLSENVDLSSVTDAQVDAMVTAYAEATSCDKSALKAEVVAQITAYEEAENVTKPDYLSAQVSITGYDLTAYRQFVKNNPIEVAGIMRLGGAYENPVDALTDGGARFWRDGVEIPVDAVTGDMLTADRLAILDADGTMHIMITPEITGSPEAINEAAASLEKTSVPVDIFGARSEMDWGWFNELYGSDLFERMRWLSMELDNYGRNVKDTWMDWRLIGSNVDDYNRRINQEFTPETTADMQAYVSEMTAAILDGKTVSDSDMEHLQSIIDLMDALRISGTGGGLVAGMADSVSAAGLSTSVETLSADLKTLLDTAMGNTAFDEIGAQAAAGVSAGLTDADMSAAAEANAGNAEVALNEAYQIHSPSRRMMPIGDYAAAGIGLGFRGYSFASDAAATAAQLETAARTTITAARMRSVGVNAMAGLRAGILAGQAGVISAMRLAARAAVNAAKSELKIKSPSRVFRDEVGSMTMKGFGEGVLTESRAQARIIRNAARYLTDETKAGSISTTSNDNRRTYNQQSSISFAGSNFYIQDKQDAYALAVEIAGLTRRRQRGKGVRMA